MDEARRKDGKLEFRKECTFCKTMYWSRSSRSMYCGAACRMAAFRRRRKDENKGPSQKQGK